MAECKAVPYEDPTRDAPQKRVDDDLDILRRKREHLLSASHALPLGSALRVFFDSAPFFDSVLCFVSDLCTSTLSCSRLRLRSKPRTAFSTQKLVKRRTYTMMRKRGLRLLLSWEVARWAGMRAERWCHLALVLSWGWLLMAS